MVTMLAYLNTVQAEMMKIQNKKGKTILKVHHESVTVKSAPVGIIEMTLLVGPARTTQSVVMKTSVESLPERDTILVRILMKILVDLLLRIDRGGGIQKNRKGTKDSLHIIMGLELK